MPGTSGSRGLYSNSARWRREAAAYLKAHPVCECEDRCGQTSAFVDHILPAKERPDLFWSRANWQALSDRCHRIKSRIEQGERGELGRVKRKSARIKGCDINGQPLDPGHWWNDPRP